MAPMDESLVLSLLARFHREVILPDIVREMGSVRDQLHGELESLRGEVSRDVGSLRGEVASVRGELESLRGEVARQVAGLRGDLTRQILAFRDELSGRMDGLRDEMAVRFLDVDGHFDKLYDRMGTLETEYHMLVQAVRRLEERPPS